MTGNEVDDTRAELGATILMSSGTHMDNGWIEMMGSSEYKWTGRRHFFCRISSLVQVELIGSDVLKKSDGPRRWRLHLFIK